MKFLFIGQGYPGVKGASSGSGIGTYLYEICQGLMARNHSCEVIVWQDDPHAVPVRQEIEGVTVHLLRHSYWPIIERLVPDSRDEFRLRHLVRQLNAERPYDWIEIESEEGIAIGCQQDFPQKVLLRAHTTLAQMIRFKGVQVGWREKCRLNRERRSFTLAPWVVTHSPAHAESLRHDHRIPGRIDVVPHGIGNPIPGMQHPDVSGGKPIVLIIGTADLRKGFDRIRPTMEAFARSGEAACFRVITNQCEQTSRLLGVERGWPTGIEVKIESRLSADEMERAYQTAAVVFHPARYESFGMPLVEAARNGTPLVTTNVGIVPSLMTGELARYVVDGDRPDECALALKKAIADGKEIGAVLMARYEAEFTRKRMADNYLECLRALK